ncbi:MAG: hypothetical protein LAO20_00940 [Acidobacteriia bacterium]|nr:hypothetical protein [Terriglobia bacterium]
MLSVDKIEEAVKKMRVLGQTGPSGFTRPIVSLFHPSSPALKAVQRCRSLLRKQIVLSKKNDVPKRDGGTKIASRASIPAARFCNAMQSEAAMSARSKEKSLTRRWV